jgi:hypothetical protein
MALYEIVKPCYELEKMREIFIKRCPVKVEIKFLVEAADSPGLFPVHHYILMNVNETMVRPEIPLWAVNDPEYFYAILKQQFLNIISEKVGHIERYEYQEPLIPITPGLLKP